jgi:pyruvate formate lyase activating enzyme
LRRAEFFVADPESRKVTCHLCPNRCVIRDQKTGACRVRRNADGVLYTVNYGRVSSYGMDPIEKKPLYHFYPGHQILSLGTVGCNLHCRFCQNWEIAHQEPSTVRVTPREVVELARGRDPTCVGIAYTYSEPLVWYEFVYDTAVVAREAGLKNVLVTNGFVEQEPLEKLLPYVDAMNIDVKAFTDDFYRRLCAGRLDPVRRTVEVAVRHCHVELTTLLVTGENDSPVEIRELAAWIAGLDPEIPLHLSRYFPNYRLDLPPTPLETMHRAREIAREKLAYVYLGNVWDAEAGNTYCPRCQKKVIERAGYIIRELHLKEGNRCAHCGYALKIVGQARVTDR